MSAFEKTNNLCFRPGSTQTELCSYRKWIEAGHFGFWKKTNCTVSVAKTKALVSCTFTKQLICAFGFVYAYCLFSYAAAHIYD